MGQFERTERLLGEDSTRILAAKRVAVFGVGGVGGYAVEALARAGIGELDLVDSDRVTLSNLNRQLHALHSTVGEYKTEVAARRARDIFPDIRVNVHTIFYLPETAHLFDFTQYDYIIDAIDTVSGKIALAVAADRAGTPIISAMGAGNKLDAAAFRVTDIYKTSVCPLARVMRTELRKRGVRRLKVVYSEEAPRTPAGDPRTPGSVPFVPGVAGLILAGEVIKDLLTSGR